MQGWPRSLQIEQARKGQAVRPSPFSFAIYFPKNSSTAFSNMPDSSTKVLCPVRQDYQLRAGNLFVYRPRQRRIALVMVAYQDESRNFDGGQPVAVFDRLQVAVNDELTVRAPHLA